MYWSESQYCTECEEQSEFRIPVAEAIGCYIILGAFTAGLAILFGACARQVREGMRCKTCALPLPRAEAEIARRGVEASLDGNYYDDFDDMAIDEDSYNDDGDGDQRASERVQIYVALVGEGLAVRRPVRAERVGRNVYRILSQPYDRNIEAWQFEPGDVVSCEIVKASDGFFLAATKSVAR